MAFDVQHEREQAHALLDLLPPAQLGAVRQLLATMVENGEDEAISPEEEASAARSREWFQHNEGIPFEQVVADLGFTMNQVRSPEQAEPENVRQNSAA